MQLSDHGTLALQEADKVIQIFPLGVHLDCLGRGGLAIALVSDAFGDSHYVVDFQSEVRLAEWQIDLV